MEEKLKALAEEIFNECEKDGEPITKEESLEMAKAELNYKENIKNYVQSEPTKERKPKERKVDSEKAMLLDYIKKGLTLCMDSTTIDTENEVKLHFVYNNSKYSVTLTKHRK